MGALRKSATLQLGGAQVEVWSDIESLRKQVRRFNKLGIAAANARALNRAANKTKTFTGKLLQKAYNIKARSINSLLKVTPKATRQRETVALMGHGPRLSIYKHSKTKPKQGPLGTRFNAGGGSKVHAHTFVQRMSSGHVGVYVRTHIKGGKRSTSISKQTGATISKQLPIRELTYPHVAHMITNDDRGLEIFRFYTKDYPIQLHAQLDWELKKSKGVG